MYEYNKQLEALMDANGITKRNYNGNKLKWPKLVMKPSDANAALFNEFKRLALEDCEGKMLVLSKRGTVLKKNGLGVYVNCSNSTIELLCKTYSGNFKLRFTSSFKAIDESGMTGRKAFYTVYDSFLKDGIDLFDYMKDNPYFEKTMIPKPNLTMLAEKDKTYEHVHHLDLHSAYFSGIGIKHPELMKTCERIYAQRNEDDKKFKAAMAMSTGYMESEYCRKNGNGYALANLKRDAVEWTNSMLGKITAELRRQGYEPLLYNTDGIWYIGKDTPMHSEYEGDVLGTYRNDHIDCKFRARGCKAYEYIENGKYHAVLAGECKYDRLKPRDEWEWGDIYRKETAIFKYRYDGEKIIKVNDYE